MSTGETGPLEPFHKLTLALNKTARNKIYIIPNNKCMKKCVRKFERGGLGSSAVMFSQFGH
jgi:hypothetical protein